MTPIEHFRANLLVGNHLLSKTLPVRGLGVVASGQNGPRGCFMAAIEVVYIVLPVKHYLHAKNRMAYCPVVAEGRWTLKNAEKVHLCLRIII